jgi:hypothetical protein
MLKTNSVNNKFLIFITFFSGMLIGCVRTEGTLKISGKVLDESTRKGIPFKDILVQALVNSNDKTEQIEVGQFSADSSGRFTYSLSRIKGAYNYNFCFIGNSDYPPTIKNISITGLQRNAKYLHFSLSKLVDLTIKINKRSKTSVYDTLHLCWESDGFYGGSLYPYKVNNYGKTDNSPGLTSGNDLWWFGGNVNSTINTKVFAGKLTKWKKEFTDTITCKRDFANYVYFTY